jgi:hypothetical protein
MAICAMFVTSCTTSPNPESVRPSPRRASSPLAAPGPVRVSTTPRDISSNVAGFDVTALLDHGGRNVPDDMVQAVASTTELRTYPGLAPVAFTSRAVASSSDFTAPKQIVFSPSSSLAPGWYVLTLKTVPQNAISFTDTPAQIPLIGTVLTRFSVGSAPVLRDVQLGSNGMVIVEFSEGIVADPVRIGSLLSVTAPDGTPCSPFKTSYPTPSVQLGYSCPTTTWSAQRVRLSISPGIVSPSGVPLAFLHDKACATSRLTRTFTRDIDFSAAESCSSNCKEVTDFIEKDTTPPTLSLTVGPTCVWPPNHKMILYTFAGGLSAVAKDECDPSPVIKVVDVTSNQPPAGGGSGNTAPDFLFGTGALCVRSERDGTLSTDREYTVTVQATDASGNSTTQKSTIVVHHDQSDPKCDKVDGSRVVADDDPRCVAP